MPGAHPFAFNASMCSTPLLLFQEEEGEDRDKPRKEVSDDDDMDDGERRQHDFHDMISHVKPKSLHSKKIQDLTK